MIIYYHCLQPQKRAIERTTRKKQQNDNFFGKRLIRRNNNNMEQAIALATKYK